MIPCLDLTAGRVVKGTNFVDLVDAGDPVERTGAERRCTPLALIAACKAVGLVARLDEQAQRGIVSSGYRPGPLSRTKEYCLNAFISWYCDALSAWAEEPA